jgi:hypothetical protein
MMMSDKLKAQGVEREAVDDGTPVDTVFFERADQRRAKVKSGQRLGAMFFFHCEVARSTTHISFDCMRVFFVARLLSIA